MIDMRPLLAMCAAAVGLALGLAGEAASDWGLGPTLFVEASGDEYRQLDVSLELTDEGSPGRISLFVPSGFAVYPVRPPGRPVGDVVITAAAEAGRSASVTTLYGDVAAAALDPETEAAAQSCSAGDHIAVWRAALSLLGQPLDLPIYIARSAPGDPARSQLRLDLCPPPLAPAGPLLPMLSLHLSLPYLASPRTPGSYMWRAYVTPLAPDGRTLLLENAYELRSLIPVPHRVTLSARYVAKDRSAVVSGRVTANGQPRAHVEILVVRLVRKVTPRGVVVLDSLAGTALTGTRGAYTLRVKMPRTAGLIAFVSPVAGRCTGSSMAPSGCRGMTTESAKSDPVTVHVPSRP